MEKGIVISMIFALIVGVFALKNGEPVIVDFIFKKFEMSQSIVILISALLGAFIIFLISSFKAIKRNSDYKKALRDLKNLEEERDSLVVKNEELVREIEKLRADKENALDGLADLSGQKETLE